MGGDLVSGVFTTARVEGGRIVRLEAHRARLESDAQVLSAPADLLSQYMRDAFQQAVNESKSRPSATVRVALGRRADGSLGHTVELTVSRRARFTTGDTPLALVSVSDPREAVDAKRFPRDALTALEHACRARCAEPLLVSGNLIREGSWFHVLAHTPDGWRAPSEGTIRGTTRTLVIAGLRARGERVDEGPLALHELSAETSLFALSALIEVAPVGSLDGAALRLDHTDRERTLLVDCLGT